MTQLDFGTNKETIEGSTLWSRSKILSQVGQEEIFEQFLRVPVDYRGLFRSPIREDENPTCSFKWVDGKLLFRDWSESRAKDCFDIVKEIHHCDFYTALEIVAKEFNLTHKDPRQGYTPKTDLSLESYERHKNNEKSIIEIKRQPFTPQDVRYLKQYHLTKKIVDYYNVFGVKAVWLNGRLFYTNSIDKPAIAYYFGLDDKGRQKWKIYFYKTRDSWRFIGNTNRINGWVQIPRTGKLLVITKSLKDVMCLAKFGIPAIAMQGESQIPYDYIIEELKERFDIIYTLMDYDRAGINAAWKIKKLYDIPAMFFRDEYDAKDFSDYLKDNGVEDTQKIVEQALTHIGLDPSEFKLPL
jgi:hypothetical protein